jgi:hypothetical protein
MNPSKPRQIENDSRHPVDFSNSGINADNQELTTQASQRDSQNPSIIADAELQRVIEAWEKLPANLKIAIMAIVRSSDFHT